MVLGVEDILEEFDYREDVNINEPSGQTSGTGINTGLKTYMGLSTEEIHVVKIIQKGIRHIDEIIERSNISVKEINNILFMLEMKGVITQQPGKIFEMYL